MEKRLIKNGNIILDGTLTREEKEMQAFQKLEEIEEISEKLGIDAAKLLKALCSKTLIFKHNDTFYYIENTSNCHFCFQSKTIHIDGDCDCDYRFQDYGKTWALKQNDFR